MVKHEEIIQKLKSIIHPEDGVDIVSLGMVEDIAVNNENIKFTIALRRARDPFSAKLKKFSQAIIEDAFPEYKDRVIVFMKEPASKEVKAKSVEYPKENASQYGKVIAISSCKGGVGKSTTTANLAVTLASMGYRVGLLDADVYGPSIPKMLGVADYKPMSEKVGDKDMIIPAENYGVKIMSIGFFIDPTNALIWRGAMATSAIKQLIGQTLWGELDFLLIDLPPGTGDIHLTVLGELKMDGAIIVSTPQQVALADVVRGIDMFQNEQLNVPILGLIENMAWFTPAELPNNKYYIFGKDGCKKLAEVYDLPLLGQIPVVQGICESGDKGKPQALCNDIVSSYFVKVAEQIIKQTNPTKKQN